jgi:phosphoheptose isomerase
MTTLHEHRATTSLADRGLARFPAAPHASIGSYFNAYTAEVARAASSVEPEALEQAAAILAEAYAFGVHVFCCGNGGSAAIANHMQCDHVKGVRTATDLTPRFVSLSASVELLTAIANDVAFEDVFAYQLQAQARRGDVLIAVSSSGRSDNILRALTWARDHGLRTIALTGFDGGEARRLAEVSVHVDGFNYGIVEDLHQAVMHTLAQYIRQSRMTPEAVLASVF